MPEWLGILAIGSLVLAGLCAFIIAIDIIRGRRQHMWIMMSGVNIQKIRDGRIVEHLGGSNSLEVLLELVGVKWASGHQ